LNDYLRTNCSTEKIIPAKATTAAAKKALKEIESSLEFYTTLNSGLKLPL
jgi:hypothetical protein